VLVSRIEPTDAHDSAGRGEHAESRGNQNRSEERQPADA
jgi:hypothetical protein